MSKPNVAFIALALHVGATPDETDEMWKYLESTRTPDVDTTAAVLQQVGDALTVVRMGRDVAPERCDHPGVWVRGDHSTCLTCGADVGAVPLPEHFGRFLA
jgi:hypothetical protein